MDADSLIAVYWPADYLEADAIRQTREGKGIACHLEGENQASWAGAGLFGNAARWRMRLLVRAADADKANQIIEQGAWPRYTD